MKNCLMVVLFMFCASSMYGQDIKYMQQLQDSSKTVINDTLNVITVIADKMRKGTIFKVTDYDLKVTVAPMGESDAIKYIQTLPGVASGMEGSSAIYVRGGNVGNNLMSLDGVPIYGSSHLLGMASVFPSSMIERTEFFMGGFTSDDANFSASHLKLYSKEGDYTNSNTAFSVSNFLVSGDVSIPIVEDRVSIVASARYSPLGLEYRLVEPLISNDVIKPDSISAGVYDVFARLTYKIDSKHKVFVSTFNSNDIYDYSILDKSYDYMQWCNMIVNGVWDYNLNEKVSIRTNVAFNDFRSSQRQQKKVSSDAVNSTVMALNSRMREYQFSSTAQLNISKGDYQFGFSVKSTMFNPGSYTRTGKIEFESGDKFSTDLIMGNKSNTLLSGLHAQAEYGEENKWHARFALRANWFHKGNYNVVDPEVRIFGTYNFTPALGIEFTADYLAQYYHTLEGVPTGWSMDMIVPSDTKNRPEKSLQFYGGIFVDAGKLHFSIGGFYKSMYNLVYFTDASNFFNSALTEWESHIQIGVGTAYGMEFLADVRGECFTGKLAYTLSKTDRTYADINHGNTIPFKFDRRHILNANISFLFGQRDWLEHGLSCAYTMSSGHYETLRSSVYEGFLPGIEGGLLDEYSGTCDYYSHPNNYRMPMYMRADMGYYINVKRTKTEHSFNLGVYNLFNRHNAYSLFWDADNVTWKKLSIWPIMPNFHYRISF